MRMFALAAAAGLGLAFAGAADARPWSDPEGRFVFDAPAGWFTTIDHSGDYTYVVTGTANNECHIAAQPVTETVTASPLAVHRTLSNPELFTIEFWTNTANGFGRVFPQQQASVLSSSIDTSGYWPIPRAEIQSSERLVHAALMLRPGFQYTAFCMTYGGADPVAVYDGVIRSIANPNDAALQAEAERQQAERDAAAEAAAQPPAPPAEEETSNRRRRN